VRITINLFAPWYLWPLATFKVQSATENPLATKERVIEALTIQPLMLSIVLSREYWRERTP
jgi:hypothetical protein